jgi:hypothetical protein
MRRTPMQSLARWHIWLGWIAAVPIVLWLASGLFMAARPIESVRGEELRRPPPPITTASLVLPREPIAATKLSLVSQLGRPTWIVTDADGASGRYSARDGAPLPPVGAAEARELVAAPWKGAAPLTALARFDADHAPGDLRQPRPSWQASFADGAHLYIDAQTGAMLAVRTRWWRAYDFAWGLHIMDLQTREDTSNAFLWLFGSLALILSLIGTVLLFRRRRARVRANA